MEQKSKGKTRIYRLFGWELNRIRTECGYSAREFAAFLAEEGAPITSTRSVYRLEENRFIPQRYVESFRNFIGPAVFDATVERLRTEPGRYAHRYKQQVEGDREYNEKYWAE